MWTLRLTRTPKVTLRQDENGHVHSNFVDFTFGANDEMEGAFGEGERLRWKGNA